ncbi:hypothetical protein LBMAG42_00030 [Deltaproteobacteria bacterium]|nr:hypothetical protein LBMAG42_00030 [Deltaproteobacteria bacterium]
MGIVWLFGCGHPLGAGELVDSGDSGAPELYADCQAENLGDREAFFDVASVREVRIALSEAALEELQDDPKTYVEGDVTLDGTTLLHVAVRLKGNSSFQDFDGKPAFKLKLNEYCPGQKYAGQKRVTLNNMTTDASQSQEVVNYQLWAAAGLFGPRASYAQVFVNEELFGLYANVESTDSEWVEERYADATGQLWEASDTAEFDAAGLAGWELKAGVDDRAPLAAVAAALDAEGDVYGNLDAVLDMDQFLSYWAWKSVIGDDDGYPWNPNDVFLYGDPELGGRFQFSPWGFDEGWKDYVTWDNAPGRLATACLAEAACSARIRDRVEEAVGAFEAVDTAGFATAAWALSAPLLDGDPRRPFTVAEVEAARVELAAAIAGRAARMRGRL